MTRQLWLTDSDAQDDTRARLSAYAHAVNTYQVIVHALKHHGLKPMEIVPGSWAFPTGGQTRLGSWLRMAFIGIKLSKRYQFDLIQAEDPLFTGVIAYFLSWYLNIPFNVCVYGSNPFDSNWTGQSVANKCCAPLARWILSYASGIQVDGTLTAVSLQNNGIAQNKIFIKPMIPIDIDIFFQTQSDQGLRLRLTCEGKYRYIALFVGRLVPQKNLETLIYVSSIIRELDVRFVIIGEGHQQPQLEELARKTGVADNFLWLGSKLRKDLPIYMATSDLFVLPSIYEGFARVLIEAAASGKPIITTKVSGAKDAILNNKSGYIVPIGAAHIFADKIKELVNDPSIAHSMGAEGRSFIKSVIQKYYGPNAQVVIWKTLVERSKKSS